MQPTGNNQPPTQQQPPQQPQWKPVTSPPSLNELFGPFVRGLRDAPRDIWQVGIVQGTCDIRAFLAHPPRWFVVTAALCAACVILFFACAFSGAVASQARYLRDLMP